MKPCSMAKQLKRNCNTSDIIEEKCEILENSRKENEICHLTLPSAKDFFL